MSKQCAYAGTSKSACFGRRSDLAGVPISPLQRLGIFSFWSPDRMAKFYLPVVHSTGVTHREGSRLVIVGMKPQQ